MAAQSSPTFRNVGELIRYLNDRNVGAIPIDEVTGAYKPEIVSTPIDMGHISDYMSAAQNPQVNQLVNMALRAIENEIKSSGSDAKIDALMRQNLSLADYQFIRRALDNNGRRV